ncbi:aminoglycoside phosphotransferase [Arthrobacter crystallopoietes BAB-32]|uniref:Aminoglycoside phosphotransferase n=1 Tax=Arthrobacter crystallopoietes BAB-32 TaxID=1246476 RepID=N1V3A2_9MICC|nr:aminoglycoside phosphotransferase [Arthrobacter crystallopoietes BAB-32]
MVRVGDTVRRPVRAFTRTIQAYLAHLHAQGFRDAPVPLGYDDGGREVLSFVPGEVPVEPLPEAATGVDVLRALARLIRRLHDAAQDWTPPENAVFGSLPGPRPLGLEPLFARPELVSHQDYCPGNVVFRSGLPAALIDFDLARPTTRVADVANALHWWAPLVHPVDRAPSLAGADIPARVRAFADAYGLDRQQRQALVEVAVRRSRNAMLTMEAAARADPVFARWWEEGLSERMPRAEGWLRANAGLIHDALLD